MSEPLSECCQAPIKIGGDDKEGTHYYVCTKCDEACDAYKCPTHVSASIGSKTSLSKVLGFYKRPTRDIKSTGYNQCIDDLDQRSPVANKLAEVLSLSFDDVELSHKDGIEKAFLLQQAQEIINKMSEWIVKKGN